MAGAKRAIYEWTRRLATSHCIDAYTLSGADHSFCDIRPLVRQHHIFGFSPKRLFSSPWGRLNQLQRWRDLAELTQLGRDIAIKIDEGNYDVIFAHTCLYTFMPAFLQFVRTPAIYYLHEPFGRRFIRKFERPYLRANKWRDTLNRFDPLIELYNHRLESLQHKSIHNTRRLLANSHFTQKLMRMAFGVEAPVCYVGVDSDNFRPMPNVSKGNCVISVGELSPRKGFDFIVESLGFVPSRIRPQLVLACNSVNAAEKAYVHAIAATYDVDLRVLTNLSTDELAVEYNRAHLCVYAPLQEPLGLVPLEAMACGMPVIGVREGGVQESIIHAHTGLLIERNPRQFAEAVQQLLDKPALASEYGRNGREHVLRNWSWDHASESLEANLIECS